MDAQSDALGHQNGRLVGVVKGLDAGHHVLLDLWRPTLHGTTFIEHHKGTFNGDGPHHARPVHVLGTRRMVAQACGRAVARQHDVPQEAHRSWSGTQHDFWGVCAIKAHHAPIVEHQVPLAAVLKHRVSGGRKRPALDRSGVHAATSGRCPSTVLIQPCASGSGGTRQGASKCRNSASISRSVQPIRGSKRASGVVLTAVGWRPAVRRDSPKTGGQHVEFVDQCWRPTPASVHQGFIAPVHRQDSATSAHDEEARQHGLLVVDECEHVPLGACGQTARTGHPMFNDFEGAIAQNHVDRPIVLVEVDPQITSTERGAEVQSGTSPVRRQRPKTATRPCLVASTTWNSTGSPRRRTRSTAAIPS